MKNKLSRIFYREPPKDLKKVLPDYACVSVILRANATPRADLEVAFIRRARNPNDPWAGHVAFPGGRREQEDLDDLATALRETREELGWQVSNESFLGHLTDIQARNRSGILNFFLRPLVFYVNDEFSLASFDSSEVEEVFWIPLTELSEKKRQTKISLSDRGLELPGIQLSTGDVLWGLTLAVILELQGLLEKDFS